MPRGGDPTEAGYGEFPLRSFLGMDVETTEPGRSVATAEVTGELLNPHGVVHGAVLFALADTSMGAAVMSMLDPSANVCASIDVSLRFLRPVTAGTLRAETTVLRRGARIVHLDSRILRDEELVATAVGTFAVLPVTG